MLAALRLLLSLLLPAAPAGGTPAQVPPWLGRCLAQVRQAGLEQGAPLPTDSPRGTDYGTCAARCAGRCFLSGDFDGDGKAQEVAVASPTELLVFHDVERGKVRRARPRPAGKLPLSGDEVALLAPRRTARFLDEVGLLRDGKSSLPALPPGARLAFGLIVWRGVAEASAEAEEDDELDHGRSAETGDLLLAIYEPEARAYRLQKVLQLGGGI